MEYWKVEDPVFSGIGFLKKLFSVINTFHFPVNMNFTNNPCLRAETHRQASFHIPRTQYSNIPVFQHSNCERSELTWIKGILLLLPMILLFIFPVSAHAEDAQFLWSTRFSVSQEYNDNIDLDSADPKDDWITTFSQGIALGIRTEEIDTNIDFSFGYAFYQENPDNNSIRTDINLSGFEDIPITENLILDLDESLKISEDPIESDELVASEHTGRNRYMRNRLTARLAYQFGEDDQFYWGYGNIILENTDPDTEDSFEHRPFIGMSYWFDPRHGVDIGLSYAMGKFETSSDFDDIAADATYTFRLSPSTSSNLSYSTTSKNFDDQEEIDYKVQNISLGLSHQLREDLSASLSAGFYRQDPDERDPDSGFTGSVGVNKQFENGQLSITGNIGYREQYFEAENLGFGRETGISASYSFLAIEDLNVSLTGLYRENEYPHDSPRKDKTWHTGITLSYPFLEWLTASLNLSHRDHDSTEENNDYSVNRIFFTLTIPYEGKPIDF